jgi:hypothetical protein
MLNNKRSLQHFETNEADNVEATGKLCLNEAPNKLTTLMSPRLSIMTSTKNKLASTNSVISGTKSSITPRLFVNHAKKEADEEVNELSILHEKEGNDQDG